MSTDRYEVTDPDLVDRFEADSRGRVSLGPDFAGKPIKVAVQVLEQDDTTGESNQ